MAFLVFCCRPVSTLGFGIVIRFGTFLKSAGSNSKWDVGMAARYLVSGSGRSAMAARSVGGSGMFPSVFADMSGNGVKLGRGLNVGPRFKGRSVDGAVKGDRSIDIACAREVVNTCFSGVIDIGACISVVVRGELVDFTGLCTVGFRLGRYSIGANISGHGPGARLRLIITS